MKSTFWLLIFLVLPVSLAAQESVGNNTDLIYRKALKNYKSGNFHKAHELTTKGLRLAPQYHDIRILRIRTSWALSEIKQAEEDLEYLLAHAAHYPGVKLLVLQNSDKFHSPSEALNFLKRALQIYPDHMSLQVRKAKYLLQKGHSEQARNLALELIFEKSISGKQRYSLQQILKRTITNEIAVNYHFISFSEEYSRSDFWNTTRLEYQHNLKTTAVIARMSYSDRGYDDGMVYELQAYPVFSDKFYASTSLAYSDAAIFPDLKGSASFFYNFASVFEAEIGSRVLFYDNTYFSAIFGITAYSGKFYFNLRSFLGPKRAEQLVQNYQFNMRFYFMNSDNYLFLRLGNGVSPDETIRSNMQIRPSLDARYVNLGINKSVGIKHILQVSIGMLYEDITSRRKGEQIMASVGYRYRF